MPVKDMPQLAKLGRYEIVSELGRGAMGIVYRAYDAALDRTVAVKVMGDAIDANAGTQKRFQLEARAIAKLQHPNIVAIHELVEDENGAPHIAMEFLEGEDLETRIRRERVPVVEALKLAIRICEGLDHAHAKDLVHRDVKPANVFLTRDGGVKLMDFGMVQWHGADGTNPQTVAGTADYMSPEQVRGQTADARSDIFSVGVVLYRLLSGKLPFTAERLESILYNVVHTEAEKFHFPDAKTRPELLQIVLRALAKDPDARHSAASELAEELGDWLALHAEEETDLLTGPGAALGSPPMAPAAALKHLKKHTRNEKDFPMLRRTAVSLMRLPDGGSAKDAADIVSKDPALTARLLKVANSAHFNRGGSNIQSVSRAATILGLDLVRNVCLGLGFAESHQQGQTPELREVSACAFFAASIGKEIGIFCNHDNPEEVFTGSLLYSLPRIALAFHLGDVHRYVEDAVHEHRVARIEAERRALTVPLTKLGMSMATQWQLPPALIEAMGASETNLKLRAKSTGEITIAAAYLSNRVASNVLAPSGSDREFEEDLQGLERAFAIDDASAVEMIRRAHQRAIEFAEPFGIDLKVFEPPERPPEPGPDEDTLRGSLLIALCDFFDAPPET